MDRRGSRRSPRFGRPPRFPGLARDGCVVQADSPPKHILEPGSLAVARAGLIRLRNSPRFRRGNASGGFPRRFALPSCSSSPRSTAKRMTSPTPEKGSVALVRANPPPQAVYSAALALAGAGPTCSRSRFGALFKERGVSGRFHRLIRDNAKMAFATEIDRGVAPHVVLLDYFNIPAIQRRQGAERIVRAILDTLASTLLADDRLRMLRIRFYGGWYSRAALSKYGQDLLAQLNAIPMRWTVETDRGDLRLTVQAQLARSMLADPTHHVLHTLRRGTPPSHEVRPLPFRGCVNPGACPIAPVEELVVRKGCPLDSCPTPISAVFPRQKSQKLVDTMMVSDLIYLACTTRRPTVVVSTDDDLWPGIRTALRFGLPVHHIHPGSRTTPAIYKSATLEASYREYRFQ